MTFSEFRLEERGSRLFDRWIWGKTIATPLGNFEVVLHQNDEEILPDDSMVKFVAELVSFTETNCALILDIVFGYYRLAEVSDPLWLDCNDVPRGLTKTEIKNYMQGLWLVVSRRKDSKNPYESVIFMNPLWDEEHKLSLEFQDGKII